MKKYDIYIKEDERHNIYYDEIIKRVITKPTGGFPENFRLRLNLYDTILEKYRKENVWVKVSHINDASQYLEINVTRSPFGRE